MERKPPPQAAAEGDRKPAAAEAGARPPSKRRRTAPAPGDDEVVDVAAGLEFAPGDRLEVKWTINDDDEPEGGEDGEGGAGAKPEDGDGEGGGGKCFTVWWSATLVGKTEKLHTLTDEERQESEIAIDTHASPAVKVPIYRLNYAPLEEHGFDTHSLEDVAFISNQTLLNLSTEEMMTFRRVGEPSPPPSPTPVDEDAGAARAPGPEISREFSGQDEVGDFMNQLMQQCMERTGMDEKMKDLPRAQQLVAAERIQKAKEGFLARMMAETDKMGPGNKVITADVVRRCMAQMEGGY